MTRALPLVAGAAWVAAFLAYAAVTIAAVPYIDDWHFLARLRIYLDDGALGAYLLAPHNGHTMLPSRLVVLAAHQAGTLQLDALRWLSVAVLVATAALHAGWARARVGAAWPLASLPLVTLWASAGHWELLSVATGLSNLCLPLFAVAAVVAFGRAQRGAGDRWIAAAVAAALGATLCLSAGALTWWALALQAWLGPSPLRRWAPPFAALGALLVLAAAQIAQPAGARPADGPALVVGVAIVAGTSVIGLVDNAPATRSAAAAGLVLAAATVATLLAAWHARGTRRHDDAPPLALLAFGWATVAAVAVGRASFGADALAASRYAALAAPVPAAVYLFWLGRGTRRSTAMACVLGVGIVAGGLRTTVEEFAMAGPRAAFMADQVVAIRCRQLRLDAHPELAAELAATTDFLERERLSVFATPAVPPCPSPQAPQ